MANTTYEHVLRDAQQLSPEERERLVGALRPARQARVATVRELQMLLQQGGGQARPLTDEERAAFDVWMEETRRLAASIGAAWKDKNVSAADAVSEQRRSS